MKEAIRFIIVGGSSTFIDFLIYILLCKIGKIDISLAKTCSMLTAGVFSYFLNKSWTFKVVTKNRWITIFKYCMVFIVNISINVTMNKMFYLMTGSLGVSFVLATSIAMVINYLLQRHIVFKNETKLFTKMQS